MGAALTLRVSTTNFLKGFLSGEVSNTTIPQIFSISWFSMFPNLDLFKMLGNSKDFRNGGLMVMGPMVESVKHRLQQTQVIQLASLPGGDKSKHFFKGNNKSSLSTGQKNKVRISDLECEATLSFVA